MNDYRHTQRGSTKVYGTALLIVFGALAIVRGRLPATDHTIPTSANWFFFGVPIAITLVVLALMSSLTIEVTATTLRWHFGPGIWKKHMNRQDIARVEPIRTSMWWGYGIHMTPKGWLYNVGGRDAVLVTRTNGRQFILGTNDLPGLLAALR